MQIGNIRQAAHYGVVDDVPMQAPIAEDLNRVATAREAMAATATDGRRHHLADARVAMRYAGRSRTDGHPRVRGG